MDKCGYSFVFGNGKLDICFNSIVVGSRNLCDGLYMLNVNEMSVNFVVGTKGNRKDDNSSILCHRRLRHISRPHIERLIKEGILPNLDISDFETHVDFLKGKFTTKTRNTKANICENVLQFIHTNMCRPITPNAMGG